MITDRPWYIYALVDPRTDEVRYVGWSFDPQRRLKSHISTSKQERSHKSSWIKQLLSLGMLPMLSILETGYGSWSDAECRWIAHYRETGARLTNLTKGGDGMPGYVWTDEQRGRLRARVFTSEHRARIARAKTGQTITPSARAKISAARKGVALSADHYKKLVASHTGKPLSEQHRNNIAQANKGKPVSPESRARMSAAQRKRSFTPLTEAHKQNLSAAKIGKPQLCGLCKSPDHNRRTCPRRTA